MILVMDCCFDKALHFLVLVQLLYFFVFFGCLEQLKSFILEALLSNILSTLFTKVGRFESWKVLFAVSTACWIRAAKFSFSKAKGNDSMSQNLFFFLT